MWRMWKTSSFGWIPVTITVAATPKTSAAMRNKQPLLMHSRLPCFPSVFDGRGRRGEPCSSSIENGGG